METILWFKQIRLADTQKVGGKNASLGEMISQLSQKGIRVPNGFAITTAAFKEFISFNLLDKKIDDILKRLDISDIKAASKSSTEIRSAIEQGCFPAEIEEAIRKAYQQLEDQLSHPVNVAVRSSAVGEDSKDASFAGQQETYLHVNGIENVLIAIKKVFSSLYDERTLSYRFDKGFSNMSLSISVGIQQMVHADEGASGVMFTLDTESGFNDVILINASYGLGEAVVQGEVIPDEFYVHKKTLGKVKNSILSRTLGNKKYKATYSKINEVDKTLILSPVYEELQNIFSISDEEVLELAKYGLLIEEHYQQPMDIEWAKDGIDGKIYILQARPETVVSSLQKSNTITRYTLTSFSKVLAEGRAVGQKISTGKVCVLNDPTEMDRFKNGDILSTDITDPNWEPIMKKASAILTKRGGRTCHAAIVARELGIPALVGCGESLNLLHEGQSVTVSCAEGDMGYVYEGILEFTVHDLTLDSMPPCPVKIAMNVGNPHLAYRFQSTPNTGIGLARLEFIINSMIGIHPMAAHNFPHLPIDLKMKLREKCDGYASPKDFFVEKMAEGISTLAAAFWPKPVIVRLSDFKSNEYRNLIGGELYEPLEENPMIGWRGASRYISPNFKDCFTMECEALKRARDDKGLKNVEIMIPFVRTVSELQAVIQELESHSLKRDVDGLRIIMMCEIPSNALLADQFLEHIDGFSIGSNDMTQLTLGVDRDSGLMQHSFDERDEAVKVMLKMAIQACRKANKYVGICGQGPSDYPELAKWLAEEGIESISLNPDTVIDTWLFLAKALQTDQ